MTDDILTKTRAWAEAFAAPMPAGLDALIALADEDVRFADPFNDVRGHAALREILIDMVERTEDPTFDIVDIATSETVGYIRWTFQFRPKGTSKAWQFDGMTELHFSESGKVAAHLDHWDSGAQLYAKLPILGWVVNKIRKKLAVTQPPH